METAQDAYRRMLREELGPRLQALGFIAPVPPAHDDAPPLPHHTTGPTSFGFFGAAPTTPPADYTLDAPGHHALLGPHEYWANNTSSFQFTINVLVTSHTDWQTFRTRSTDFTGNPWPAEPDTHTHYGPTGPWTERLGQLMGMGDKWWYISPRRPTDTIADEVATAIQQYALPAMHKHMNP